MKLRTITAAIAAMLMSVAATTATAEITSVDFAVDTTSNTGAVTIVKTLGLPAAMALSSYVLYNASPVNATVTSVVIPDAGVVTPLATSVTNAPGTGAVYQIPVTAVEGSGTNLFRAPVARSLRISVSRAATTNAPRGFVRFRLYGSTTQQ